MQKKLWNLLTVILLGAVLLAVPIGWICNANQTFSASERRYLADAPDVSKQSLTDWTFDDSIESYLCWKS